MILKACISKAVAEALGSEMGTNAASLTVAENYVKAFGNLAKNSNTVLLPSNPGDVSGMVSQAMAIYKKLDKFDGSDNAAPAAATNKTEAERTGESSDN